MITYKTDTADQSAVSASAALIGDMAARWVYAFVATVACYIKQADAVYEYATLDAGGHAVNLDTVFRAAERGADGNSITLTLVADSVDGVTIDEAGDAVTIHFEDGVSTVADVEAAVAADATLIAVDTAGTGASVLDATDDEFGPTALAGGDTVASPIASAADGSALVPAGVTVHLHGVHGANLSVVRATADGVCTLTQVVQG